MSQKNKTNKNQFSMVAHIYNSSTQLKQEDFEFDAGGVQSETLSQNNLKIPNKNPNAKLSFPFAHILF